MSSNLPLTELEQKIREFEDQPGFLLGLDGWTLRSVPVAQRSKFLAAYEKALQVAHHPDLFPNVKEKERHQKYLQAVSEAIGFMTGDTYAYELATEDVPTKQNHVIRLQDRIGGLEADARNFESRLSEKTTQLSQVIAERTELEKISKKSEERAAELTPIARLKAYQDWYVRNNKTYGLGNMERVVIHGTKIKSMSDEVRLQDVIPNKGDRFKAIDAAFNQIIQEKYLSTESVILRFDKGVAEYTDYTVRLIGGFPSVAIQEFINYRGAKIRREQGDDFAEMILDSMKLTFTSKSDIDSDGRYEKRIIPFTTPYIALQMPILAKYEQAKEGGWSRYDLFYVNQIKEVPKVGAQ